MVVYHTLYIVKGVAVYQKKWLDEQKSESKAEREAPGDTNPSEPAKINMKFVACPSTQRWIVLDFQIPTVLNHSLLLPKAFSLPTRTSKTL